MVRDGEQGPARATRTTEEWFSYNLKTARTAQGMTQAALAAEMSERGFAWHQATVYKVENGSRQIQLGEAQAVAELLKVPLDHLMADGNELDRYWLLLTDKREAVGRQKASIDFQYAEIEARLNTLGLIRGFTQGEDVPVGAVWDALAEVFRTFVGGFTQKKPDFVKTLVTLGVSIELIDEARTQHGHDTDACINYIRQHHTLQPPRVEGDTP